jgi:hypothetical protein
VLRFVGMRRSLTNKFFPATKMTLIACFELLEKVEVRSANNHIKMKLQFYTESQYHQNLLVCGFLKLLLIFL